MRRLINIILSVWIFPFGLAAQSGLCDVNVPFYSLNLSGSVDSTYISPSDIRTGLCCGNSSPDRCIEFEITLDAAAVGINFDIYSGAQPPGALFYQINCGAPVPIGQPICLSGSGPHTLTFCKPGNNVNQYSITSIPGYTSPSDLETVTGCDITISALGLIDSTIRWREITSGTGAYDAYLSCLTGCDKTILSTDTTMPGYIDIELTGALNTVYCTSLQDTIFDTIRVTIYDQPEVSIIPDPAILCMQDSSRLLSASVNYHSKGSLVYEWQIDSSGTGMVVGNDSLYAAIIAGTYNLIVYDTLYPNCSRDTNSILLVSTTNPVVTTSINDTICQGQSALLTVSGADSYQWTPSVSLFCDTCISTTATPLSSTLYHVQGSDSNGCTASDSVWVIVLSNSDSTISVSQCYGDTLLINSKDYFSSGIYQDTFIAGNGCDSILTINLLVYPSPETILYETICLDDSIEVGNSVYNTTGIYYDTLMTATGCDSVITTNLTVFTPTSFILTSTLCFGDTFLVGSSKYTISGTYKDTLTNASGCDSFLTSNLSFLTRIDTLINAVICAGDSLIFDGYNYTTQGLYYDTVASALTGCDSFITLNLTVLPNTASVQSITLCYGDSLTIGSNVYSSSGTYFDTLVNSHGCDSVVTINFTILPRKDTVLFALLCSDDSFHVGTSSYFVNGTFQDTLISLSGCDSFVTSSISYFPDNHTNINTTLCDGESFQVGTSIYITSGTYRDTLPDENGCDSIITANLTVLLNTDTLIYRVLCFGDTISVAGSIYFNTGIYHDTLIAANGCDSIITTDITVLPSNIQSLNRIICAGDSVIIGMASYFSSGSFSDTLVTANGCDSVVNLNLIVLIPQHEVITASLCPGDSALLGAYWYFNPGLYYDTSVAISGCDSIIHINIIELSNDSTILDIDLCQGDTLFISGSAYTTSGTYYDSLKNINGCDSIVTINLNIVAPIITSITSEICTGEFYAFAGLLLDSTGQYADSLVANSGCDSVVILTLQTYPQPNIQLTGPAGICLGDTAAVDISGAVNYQWRTNSNISCNNCSSANFYPDTTTMLVVESTDQFGCRYVDSMDITVWPSPRVFAIPDIIACVGEEVTISADTIGVSAFQWEPISDLSSQYVLNPTLQATDSANYVITVHNAFGCSSYDSLGIQVIGKIESSINADTDICRGDLVTLVANVDQASDQGFQVIWFPQDAFEDPTSIVQTIVPDSSAQYTVIVRSSTCESDTQNVSINVNPNPIIDLGADQRIYNGEEVSLTATSSQPILNYSWTPADHSTCGTCETIMVTPSQSMIYSVLATDYNGCTGMDEVYLQVVENCYADIFIPNAFTPNGDEINDHLLIRTNGDLQLQYWRIFDRWGRQVYYSEDIREGWNGNVQDSGNANFFHGERDDSKVLGGVYVYHLKASCSNGSVAFKKGNVTIIR